MWDAGGMRAGGGISAAGVLVEAWGLLEGCSMAARGLPEGCWRAAGGMRAAGVLQEA